MNLSPDHRGAGVLAPLFALRGHDDLGIGDVAALREFVDWAAGVGFRIVQLLPINEIGGDNSPYNAISSVAIEPTTLHLAPGSPVDLTPEDFNATVAEVGATKLRKGAVNYDAVRRLKRRLLEQAFTRFRQRDGSSADFAAFSERERTWLDPYTFFRALMEENGDSEAWDCWREEHRSAGAARDWLQHADADTRARFAEREMFFRYVQWIAHEQWAAVKNYAAERGVALMGDIPFGISLYSADVFANPGEFHLDWSGGAPPEPYFKDDEFTQKWGQNWGIPLYNWETMRAGNFTWWRQRVRAVGRAFHVFRIDHVLGFYRIYGFPWRPARNAEMLPLSWEEMLSQTGGSFPHFVPRDDSTPDDSETNRREGEEYLRMALEAAGSTRLVGEDLGTVPEYVRPSLHSLGIAGFKIPQWESHRDGRIVSGKEYERLSVATYATHDHKPLRAMWDEVFEHESTTREQSRGDLHKIAEFAGITSMPDDADFDRDFYAPALEALFRCEAWMAIVMITDLLARDERFNIPGTATGSNWSTRMHVTVRQLSSNRAVTRRMKLIRQLLQTAGRV